MLTCIFHPINPMQIVEDDAAESLIASGVWFDSPAKAQEYRAKVENKIKQESKALKPKIKQLKGSSDER